MPDLSFAEVGHILRLLESIEASEVDLEWGDLRLRVRHVLNNGSAERPAVGEVAAPSADFGALSNHLPDAPADSAPQTNGQADESPEVPDHWVAISAPMVGTFYRSPKPGEPAYVEAGDVVAAGDTVGLVEVMKLFTELKTEVAGKVARIEADDTSLVEFGQILIWIEPA